MSACVECKRTPRLARGLCVKCYHHHRFAGTLIDFERQLRPADELLAEWDELRRDGYTRRNAAERIGVTIFALSKAIQRANRKRAA